MYQTLLDTFHRLSQRGTHRGAPGKVVISISKMKNQRLSEARWLESGHITSKRKVWGSSQELADSKICIQSSFIHWDWNYWFIL